MEIQNSGQGDATYRCLAQIHTHPRCLGVTPMQAKGRAQQSWAASVHELPASEQRISLPKQTKLTAAEMTIYKVNVL